MEGNPWTWSENKVFGDALAEFPAFKPDEWEKIAQMLGTKSAVEVKEQYDMSIDDLNDIESDRISLPEYPEDMAGPTSSRDYAARISSALRHVESDRKKGTPSTRKGAPWTKEEHRLFLVGLEKYGRGDWRSISRNVIRTRTASQVASHAQKYFLRQQNAGKKQRKRSSIHDITTVDGLMTPPLPTDQNCSGPATPPLSADQNWSGPTTPPLPGDENWRGPTMTPLPADQNWSGVMTPPLPGDQNWSGPMLLPLPADQNWLSLPENPAHHLQFAGVPQDYPSDLNPHPQPFISVPQDYPLTDNQADGSQQHCLSAGFPPYYPPPASTFLGDGGFYSNGFPR